MFYDEPIFFEKNRVYRVYLGGKLFSDFFNDDSVDGSYPEEWVASSVKALNEVSAGEYEGVSKIKNCDMYLNDAVEKYKKEILGKKESVGILTKILDAAIRLPVQTHPSRAFSKKYFHSQYGKEESWVILATRPGAKVYYGFKDGVTRQELEKAVKASETDKKVMENLLCSYDVKAGDVVFIPAGIVHAIGYGCLLLEVQEPSDFTVQPECWCGEHHLTNKEMYCGLDNDIALDCFNMNLKYKIPLEPKILTNKNGVLYESFIDNSNTENFAVRKITLTSGKFTMEKTAGVYVVIDGEGEITSEGYNKKIKKGDYFLLPNNAVSKYSILSDNMQVIECYNENN